VKPYAAMGGLHAGIDALLEIGARRPLVADEIDRIHVDLGHAVFHHGWWPPERPLSPTGAQMNIAYSLAVAALDGTALAHQYAPDRIDRDDVWELMSRVEAHHDEEFDALGPMGRGQTRVRVRFTDGTEETSEQFAARSVLVPMTTDEVVAKFRSLTTGVVEPERAAAIESFVLALDHQPDLRPLVDLLAAPVTSPF
jgi:aconitate decarboxylase